MPLRNRFNVALAYPAIELTLLDDQNNVALRRVLFPQDYVAPGTPIAAGLPPHMTQTMIVRLDTGNAVASISAYRFSIRNASLARPRSIRARSPSSQTNFRSTTT